MYDARGVPTYNTEADISLSSRHVRIEKEAATDLTSDARIDIALGHLYVKSILTASGDRYRDDPDLLEFRLD